MPMAGIPAVPIANAGVCLMASIIIITAEEALQAQVVLIHAQSKIIEERYNKIRYAEAGGAGLYQVGS